MLVSDRLIINAIGPAIKPGGKTVHSISRVALEVGVALVHTRRNFASCFGRGAGRREKGIQMIVLLACLCAVEPTKIRVQLMRCDGP